jgi:hypothetical protein
VNRFAADAEVRIGNSALSILLPTMSQPRAVKTLARWPRLISCEIVPAFWPVLENQWMAARLATALLGAVSFPPAGFIKMNLSSCVIL